MDSVFKAIAMQAVSYIKLVTTQELLASTYVRLDSSGCDRYKISSGFQFPVLH